MHIESSTCSHGSCIFGRIRAAGGCVGGAAVRAQQAAARARGRIRSALTQLQHRVLLGAQTAETCGQWGAYSSIFGRIRLIRRAEGDVAVHHCTLVSSPAVASAREGEGRAGHLRLRPYNPSLQRSSMALPCRDTRVQTTILKVRKFALDQDSMRRLRTYFAVGLSECVGLA